MDREKIIKQVKEFVRDRLEGESSGHDWWHTYRVWNMAVRIGKEEKDVDLFVVQLAALLHDIDDWKFNGGDLSRGSKLARNLLKKFGVEDKIIEEVCEIIENISFKGGKVKNEIKTKEGKVVQDADRLDALGAIGIARCFATGAKLKREIYNPKIKPKIHKTFGEYKNSNSTSINHFYEKLLILKMNTKTAKKIAEKRQEFMKEFLREFFREWKGLD